MVINPNVYKHGEDGATFKPSVSPNGVISWENDKNLPNPDPVDITGPQGPQGANGIPATHEWSGTVLTVTSASGTSSADLKGEKGDKGEPGEGGTPGSDGATFTPSVSEDGVLSWTNDKGLQNPPSINIKGPKGDPGEDGEGSSITPTLFDLVSLGLPDIYIGEDPVTLEADLSELVAAVYSGRAAVKVNVVLGNGMTWNPYTVLNPSEATEESFYSVSLIDLVLADTVFEDLEKTPQLWVSVYATKTSLSIRCREVGGKVSPESEVTVIVDETTLSPFDDISDAGILFQYVNASVLFTFKSGETYTVVWDGVEYELTAFDHTIDGITLPVLGDANIMNFVLDSITIPFAIAVVPASLTGTVDGFMVTTTSPGESHTLKVYQGESSSISWYDLTDRPFYDESTTKTLFTNEGAPMTYTDSSFVVPAWAALSDGGMGVPVTSDIFSLWYEEWTSAKITLDGVEYVCEPFEADGIKGIGNPYFATVDSSTDNGLPFLFGIAEIPEAIYLLIDTSTPAPEDPSDASQLQRTLTFSLEVTKETVKTLDPKFLSDIDYETQIVNKPFGEESTQETVLAETTYEGFFYNSNYGLYLYHVDPIPFVLTLGETYKVIWDGAEYECVAQDMSAIAEGGVGIGNLSIAGGVSNDEPFIVGYSLTGVTLFSFSSETAHTVSILKDTTVVKTIDLKYLPAELYTEIDIRIDRYIEEALGGDY